MVLLWGTLALLRVEVKKGESGVPKMRNIEVDSRARICRTTHRDTQSVSSRLLGVAYSEVLAIAILVSKKETFTFVEVKKGDSEVPEMRNIEADRRNVSVEYHTETHKVCRRGFSVKYFSGSRGSLF